MKFRTQKDDTMTGRLRGQGGRLRLETLEDRTALTTSGTISGVAFLDRDLSGTLSSGDAAAPGATVILSGQTITGERVNVTAAAGSGGAFSFTNVIPGTYTVRGGPTEGLVGTPSVTLTLSGFDDPASVSASASNTRAVAGIAPGAISLRQFMSAGADGAFGPGGTGQSEANYRPNSAPVSTQLPAVDLGKTGLAQYLDLAGFFTDADTTNSVVRLDTSAGAITLELFDATAPRTVANFLTDVTNNVYDNVLFHRLGAFLGSATRDVLQAGLFRLGGDGTGATLTQVDAGPKVLDEVGLPNTAGTVAFAKTDDPNSATNQFFFNLVDNTTPLSPANQVNGGFTVFGRIDPGSQSVLNALAALNVQDRSSFNSNLANLPLAAGAASGASFPSGTTASDYALIKDVAIVKRDENLTYSVVNNPSAALSATFEGSQLKLQVTDTSAVGEVTVQVKAADRFGASVTGNVTVKFGNHPPTASVALDTTSPNADGSVKATVTRSDADADPVSLHYLWKVGTTTVRDVTMAATTDTLGLAGLSLNPGDVITLSVTPNDGTVNGNPATATATVNRPPTASAITDKTFSGAGAFTFNAAGSFSDPDGQTLTYTATLADGSALPSWLSITPAGVLSGNPDRNEAAGLSVKITATDGRLSSSSTFGLAVKNDAPGLNDTPVMTGVQLSTAAPTPATTVTATALANDADGDTLTFTYVWSVVRGNATIELTRTTNSAAATDTQNLANFTVLAGDLLTVDVTASDGLATSGTIQGSASVRAA